jgi:hypothetical protein
MTYSTDEDRILIHLEQQRITCLVGVASELGQLGRRHERWKR